MEFWLQLEQQVAANLQCGKLYITRKTTKASKTPHKLLGCEVMKLLTLLPPGDCFRLE
jgi:hypothetical protein